MMEMKFVSKDAFLLTGISLVFCICLIRQDGNLILGSPYSHLIFSFTLIIKFFIFRDTSLGYFVSYLLKRAAYNLCYRLKLFLTFSSPSKCAVYI